MKIWLVWTHWKLLDDTKNLVNEISPYLDIIYILVDEEQEWMWIPYNAQYEIVPNEGFDVWKYYNFFKKHEDLECGELLLVNSTVSPVSSFENLMDYAQNSSLDCAGATSAYSEYESCKSVGGYHIQSFFLYLKWKCIKDTINYYLEHGIVSKFDWVKIYEVWFTKFLIDNGYKCGAFLEADYMMGKYWWTRCDLWEQVRSSCKANKYREDWEFNGVFQYPEQYLKEGLPFIKNSLFKYHFRPPLIQYLSNLIYKSQIELD